MPELGNNKTSDPKAQVFPASNSAPINKTVDGVNSSDRFSQISNDHSMHPLLQLTLARIREFVREPEAVFWVFVFPVLLAIALGIAFRSTGPMKIRVAVEVRTDVPRSIASQLRALLSHRNDIEAVLLSSEEAIRELQAGRVSLVLGNLKEPVLSERLARPDKMPTLLHSWLEAVKVGDGFVYRYDPTRPESQVARLAVDDALQRALGRKDVAKIGDEEVVQLGARYIDFLIPGLVGLNLMGSGMWGLGFAVVQTRTRKLLKLMAATPMRRTHFLLSFMFSRLSFLVLEVAALVGFGWLAFRVSVHGSIFALGMVSLIGAMTFAGLGLLVASRPRTIEGVSGLMNLVMMPMWVLSGTFFSSLRFPEFLQPVIRVLPLTALNDSLRKIINEGLPLTSSLSEMSVMLVWGGVSFFLALRWFRWQ